MLLNKTGYGYNDITIIPEKISLIEHRGDCDPFTDDNMLPIFTAPMSTIIDENNYDTFYKNQIQPILPRNVDIDIRKKFISQGKWVALSMKEFIDLYINTREYEQLGNYQNVCIDIANGHMYKLYYTALGAKKNFYNKFGNGSFQIMVGNIANPETYKYIIEYNIKNFISCNRHDVINYVRVGIGGGDFCITSSNTAIHYPQASLIDECYKYKEEDHCPKIIADGGIRNYSDVIKALSLGADYVMIGSLFVSAFESCATIYIDRGTKIDLLYDTKQLNESEETKREDISNNKLYKYGYGMASKKAQFLIAKSTTTAEGIEKRKEVKYTLHQWVDNMISYLRSAMSYCGCNNIYEFIGSPQCIINSPNEVHAVNK